MFKKAWEKVDQWVTLVLGAALMVGFIFAAIKIAEWAEPVLRLFRR